jgi:hypothetical protein
MKYSIQNIIVLILITIFLSGFVVLLNGGLSEHEKTVHDTHCPNMLVRNGNRLVLFNSNKKKISSFNNLEEYEKYLIDQQKKGFHCPVLYIQEENNAQGNDIYKMYSDPFQIQSGIMNMPLSNTMESMDSEIKPIVILDANRDNYPYNANNYPGFDPSGLNVGEFTTVDAVHNSTQYEKKNDNAMDTNWQGVIKSRESVATGKYIDNEVNKVTYPNKNG